MLDKKKQALEMYMSGTATQTQIAAQVGISERTLYSWIKDNGWLRLRQASLAAPIMIADELCTQLINLQQSIAAREEGKQFPTLQEANITGKLIMSLGRLKNFPSISQSLQVLQAFRHYVRDRNKDAAWQVGHYMESFLEDRAKFGFVPSRSEYGINPVNPFGVEDTPPPATTAAPVHRSPLPEDNMPCPATGREVRSDDNMTGGPAISVSASRTLLDSTVRRQAGFEPGTTGNSEPEISTVKNRLLIDNEHIVSHAPAFRHQQKSETSGNQAVSERGIDNVAVAGNGEENASSRSVQKGVCDGCLPWRSHETTDTLNNDNSCDAPANLIEQPIPAGNPTPGILTEEEWQTLEIEEVVQEIAHFHHQPAHRSFSQGGQEPANSGNSFNSQALATNPLTIAVNWPEGPNPFPVSVVFTLPGGKQEEVPFARLVEVQVKRSIGNQKASPGLYEAHRKAAEIALAGNLRDKKYHVLDFWKKAS